ncbi:MAG: AI-2E family transporter, partial [Clostridia bacterium]|nr:AI-2E family transporter [Clostridia bacterium]
MDSRRLLVFFGNILGGAATAGLVLWVLAHFKGTLTVLAIGWFLAFLLRPAVEAVARVVVLRVLAVLIVYAALAGAAALGVALAAGPVARQLAELVASLPAYAADAQRLAAYWLGLVDAGRLGVDLTVLQGELLARLQAWLAPFLTGAVSVVAGVTGFLTNLILAAVVGAYLLVDGHNIQRRLLALLPPAYRPLYLRAAPPRRRGGGPWGGGPRPEGPKKRK